MKRINNSNFELLQDIIKDLKFNYEKNVAKNTENLDSLWKEVVGNKISQFSKVLEFNADRILTIVCSDSYVANELYFAKDKLLQCMNEKTENLGIKIKDVKFDYKKWKESK